METTLNNTTPRRSVQSEIEFREPAQWKIGEPVVTIMGGLPGEEKRPIGYVNLLRYDDNSKPELQGVDLDGNVICERLPNLYQYKKEFRLQEARLTKAMLIRENEQTVQAVAQEMPATKQSVEVERGTELKTARQSKAGKQQNNEKDITR